MKMTLPMSSACNPSSLDNLRHVLKLRLANGTTTRGIRASKPRQIGSISYACASLYWAVKAPIGMFHSFLMV